MSLWSQKLWAKEAILLVPLSFRLLSDSVKLLFLPYSGCWSRQRLLQQPPSGKWRFNPKLIMFLINGRARTAFAQVFTTTQGTRGCSGTVVQLGAQLPPGSIPTPPTCVGFLQVIQFSSHRPKTHTPGWVCVMMDEDAWCQKKDWQAVF